MPRAINPLCLSCAELTSAQAHLRSCWDDVRCHKRRSFYRGKLSQAAAPIDSPVPIIKISLPSVCYAVLVQWKQGSRLHAVAGELYRGSELLAKSSPIHCGALTERMLKQYLESMLKAFSVQCGSNVALFRDSVELELSRHPCPIEGCNLD